MKNLILVLGLSLIATGLVGCKETDVVNGEIPQEHLETARQYEGDYHGKMNGVRGTLSLRIEGRKAVLRFRDVNGATDLVDPRCRSRVGDLLKVRGKEKDGRVTLTGAKFAFDPANCVSVQGQTVDLAFKETGSGLRVDVSILDRREWERQCRMEPGPPPHHIPTERCEHRSVDTYFQGRFTR